MDQANQVKIPAPEGVLWGTTNIPEADRIDPEKTYKTRSGKKVVWLKIVLYNSNGHEVTFPVKGSIDRGPEVDPRYQIWTLDGHADLFLESEDDLVLA